MDILVSEGFEQSLGVVLICLVTGDVGPDRMRRQKDHRVTEGAKLSGPVMGAAAGLEQNGGRLVLGEETFESGPG